MIQLSPIDLTILIFFIVFTFGLGALVSRKQSKSTEDFILAGRKITLPMFVCTLVATWYGGILGVGEFTYRYGVVNWVTQGIFYYLFAIVFALFIAKKVQKTRILTIPDRIEEVYGKKAAVISSLFTFLMTIPAPYILILGLLLQMVTGWNLLICLIIGSCVSTLYLLSGGFKAVVRTDILQFIFMFTGFFILVPTAIATYGVLRMAYVPIPMQYRITAALSLHQVFHHRFPKQSSHLHCH